MTIEMLSDPEVKAKALSCRRCYFMRGAYATLNRAKEYDKFPALRAPILKTARAFASMATGNCTCGLELSYEPERSHD